MTQTQINGATQVKSGTLTTTQLSSSAGIVDGQLATAYIKADGTRAFTGNPNGGGFEATNFANPTSSTSLATKAYVDAVSQGLAIKQSVRFATVGTETYTVSSGSVTQITGTALDGGSPAVGDRILIKDAPAANGTGSVNSLQPGNGTYTVTNATTNLTVARSTDMSGSNSPAGAFTFVEVGTANGSAGFVVGTPSSSAAFTYGTGNIQWTQFSGAGAITVDATITKTGTQLSRPAITGDVSISTGSNAATVTKLNGTSLASLSTGLLKNTTATGVPTIATSGTDYAPATSGSSLLKGNGAGGFSTATAGTDYIALSDFVFGEVPSGTIDGTNATFTLANTPLSGTPVLLILNGDVLQSGSGNDFTISGATITMLLVPRSGDKLIAAMYLK